MTNGNITMTLAEHQNYKRLWQRMWLNFTYSTNSKQRYFRTSGGSSTCSLCTRWTWRPQFAWLLSSFDPRKRLEVPQRFKRSSKRRKKKMWRPSLRTDRETSLQTNIKANRTGHKTAKTIDHRTTTGTTINNSGDLIRAITRTGIR